MRGKFFLCRAPAWTLKPLKHKKEKINEEINLLPEGIDNSIAAAEMDEAEKSRLGRKMGKRRNMGGRRKAGKKWKTKERRRRNTIWGPLSRHHLLPPPASQENESDATSPTKTKPAAQRDHVAVTQMCAKGLLMRKNWHEIWVPKHPLKSQTT